MVFKSFQLFAKHAYFAAIAMNFSVAKQIEDSSRKKSLYISLAKEKKKGLSQ